MIKQILFIIMTTSVFSVKKNTQGPKEMENRPLSEIEQTELLNQINSKTSKNFIMTNTHYKLILDLKYQNESKKSGFKNSAVKSFYKFTLIDEKNKNCDFDFSIFGSEKNFLENLKFKENLKNCFLNLKEISLEDESSEAQDLQNGTWIPETLDNFPINENQKNSILRILDLNGFISKNGLVFNGGVFHSDLLLENQEVRRNTYRVSLENGDLECHFLIHDNENNKFHLSEDLKS